MSARLPAPAGSTP
ncbi:Protein of unknown function [Propionibacterium freudenreichii]|uniref:Uncharacterized protein n=1 Tax=Propionibacterium freudenreichii subsp. shermanii (strain ATCC 9614 / DSM 4902 / CIP 103027 / NCIMB 8099 / CIRM-BIA1) TaxID=754252 RepID=D7GHY1_PROFC|nr:Hypothetical protein PFREUD_01880 [Propionibacterium freudenreichii subsp. shermanii CIRM-BIA1]CDP48120.1 Protein of unknown function [Propionibacterium freudenreichii subsp. freudenreichii]CEG86526.1 Protein of unknown function [Propionibacterium freudenreichii]CEG87861.1 Protein of unknown function [Propionibacterium freudenreichii]CEG91054.1 Protein of unknown function [Propionibacterium freudenreichii]